MQIDSQLEAASRISGGSWSYTFLHVILPLLKPGFLSAWLLLFTIFVRELSPRSCWRARLRNDLDGTLRFLLQWRVRPMSALSIVLLILFTFVMLVAQRLLRVRLSF